MWILIMILHKRSEKKTLRLMKRQKQMAWILFLRTDDLGQSYLASGKHGETPEPFLLPKEVSIVRAAVGWAHCVSVTVAGEVYTRGWKECVPSGKVIGDPNSGHCEDNDLYQGQNSFLTEQVGDETRNRKRVSLAKQAVESSSSGDEPISAFPCLVALNPGVRIPTVAAGGRHTVALPVSDVGQVWGWRYGGEGQLGYIGVTYTNGKDRFAGISRGTMVSEGQGYRVPGSYIKVIACRGQHNVVITVKVPVRYNGHVMGNIDTNGNIDKIRAEVMNNCELVYKTVNVVDKVFDKYKETGENVNVNENVGKVNTMHGYCTKNEIKLDTSLNFTPTKICEDGSEFVIFDEELVAKGSVK
ncbi:regulator of chromosome condensation 1/beta-lactamase-inhibitor protein II [Artemisia annua]|uniref:Regulator of chromosome condensation 1/beta-lactamase-inhibitor protein II n=1 Tax=Artemisia annua TaxID=35608 RepID=A0A2U1PP47_ARTAN|nr:regulator of chromosome condensation 1/beta-lactamase-inhibitor protein II [Artemisia annua]